MLGCACALVEFVREQRAVGEPDGREQRVLGLMHAVRRDVGEPRL